MLFHVYYSLPFLSMDKEEEPRQRVQKPDFAHRSLKSLCNHI